MQTISEDFFFAKGKLARKIFVFLFLFLQKVFSPRPREQENSLMIVYDPACF